MSSQSPLIRSASRVLLILLLPVLIAGCGATKIHRQGERKADLGDWDAAVLDFAKASAMNPESVRYKMSLVRAKQRAAISHFEKAKKYLQAGQLDLGIAELQQTTVLDPTNEHAKVELEKALIEWQKRRSVRVKTELELAKERAKAKRGVPRLNPASNIPIILKFQETELSKIYEALSKASGINFLYDDRLELKKKVSIDLTNVTFESAMNTLMLMNKHFFKVIDEHTILIAEDSQQKRREIQDEVIKTFYLSNADVKDVQTLLRTLLDARKIVQNPQLNAITIRDTPNRVAIAEKIVESNDKSKAELIIDVELMEINRTVSQTLGINLSSQRYSLGYSGGDNAPLNNLGLLRQLGSWTFGPIPSVTLDFLKSDSGTRSIAKPQLRVTEGEKANLHIGDSVPIPTTTFNTTGTIGTNVVPITSFTYQEVGIVIEIEPRVHHNNEVSLNLNVEVSQLGEQVSTGQGQTAPSINTRQISSVIRLMDGETNLLAGMISDDGTEGRSGFPGLIDTPILGRIFSSNTSTRRSKDLVLTLTPHIIRIPDIREEDMQPLFIGTKNNPHLRGQETSAFGPNPFAPPEGMEEEEGEGEEEFAEEGQEVPPDAEVAEPAEAAVEPPPEPVEVTAPAGQREAEPGGPSRPGALISPEGEIEELPVAAPGRPATPSGPAPSPLTVALAPARITVAGGGGFAFNVMVAEASDLQEITLSIKYDAAVAEFDRGLEGVLMRADGTATRFVAQEEGKGTVRLELKRLGGRRGASGSGSIAAIRFRPVNPGRTLVNIVSAVALAPNGSSIPVNPTGADVTVSQ